MNSKSKQQLRRIMERGTKAVKAVANEAQRAVKRYKRKRAIKKAGQVLMEIGKPVVVAAAAAAAAVAAEHLTRRRERSPKPAPQNPPVEAPQD